MLLDFMSCGIVPGFCMQILSHSYTSSHQTFNYTTELPQSKPYVGTVDKTSDASYCRLQLVLKASLLDNDG